MWQVVDRLEALEGTSLERDTSMKGEQIESSRPKVAVSRRRVEYPLRPSNGAFSKLLYLSVAHDAIIRAKHIYLYSKSGSRSYTSATARRELR